MVQMGNMLGPLSKEIKSIWPNHAKYYDEDGTYLKDYRFIAKCELAISDARIFSDNGFKDL